MMQTSQVEFKLSLGSWIGLAVLSFATCAMFAFSMIALHPAPSRGRSSFVQVDPDCDCVVPSFPNSTGSLSIGNSLPMPLREVAPPVNQTARDEVKRGGPAEEIKQQCGPGGCVTRPVINWTQYSQTTYQPAMVVPAAVAQYASWPGQSEAEQLARQLGANLKIIANPSQNSITVYAALGNGMAWNTTNSVNTQIYSGANCFLAVLGDMQQGSTNPNFANNNATLPGSPLPAIAPSSQPVANQPTAPAPSAKQGRYQLALFLSPNDPASDLVSSWFESNAKLKQLKENCATEILTPANPIYRARFANVVLQKDFPAILFMEPDGGHVYAVGRPMLPRDDASLLADMRKGLELANSVKQAPLMNAMQPANSGAIKTQGYNWDSMIQDNMQLVRSQEFPTETDCIDQDGDGECDTAGEPWYPGKKVNDLLGGRKPSPEEVITAVLWANGSEIVQICLGFVVVALVAAIAFKLIKK